MQSLLEMIEVIYDAPIAQGDGWTELIRTFGSAFPYCRTMLGTYQNDTALLPQSANDFPDEAADAYGRHYVSVNPVVPPLLKSPKGVYFDADELVEPEAFLASEIYNEFWIPLGGLDRNTGVILENAAGFFSTFCTHYARRYAVANVEHTPEYAIKLLQPHLDRALAIQRKLEEAATTTASLSQALDAASAAIFIVDAQCVVGFQNAQAEQLLRDGDALGIDHGNRLFLVDARLDDELRRQVQAVTNIDACRVVASSAPIVVRTADNWGYVATVEPAPNGMAVSPFQGPRRAVVTLKAAGNGKRLTDALVSALFGLTRAEASIALALYRGLTIAKIAEQRNASVQTVRTQVRSIFAKTGTNRQSALTALMSRFDR